MEHTDVLIYSANEAAKVLRTDPGTIYKKLEKGDIPAYKEGANWKIPKALLAAYIENRALAEAKDRRELNEYLFCKDVG